MRHVRAMTPWPGAQCHDPRGRRLQVLRARAVADAPSGAPGELVDIEGRLLVATGAGGLELVEVAPAGKRAMAGVEFLRGARLELGARLTTPGVGGNSCPA